MRKPGCLPLSQALHPVIETQQGRQLWLRHGLREELCARQSCIDDLSIDGGVPSP